MTSHLIRFAMGLGTLLKTKILMRYGYRLTHPTRGYHWANIGIIRKDLCSLLRYPKVHY